MMNLKSLPEPSGGCEESWCPPCEHLHERGLLVGVTSQGFLFWEGVWDGDVSASITPFRLIFIY